MTAAESTLANSSLPWFVRGRAAVLLSTEQALKVDVSLASLSAEAPDASRVDFVAGVANSPVSDMRSNILKDARRRPLHEAVINLVEEAGVANL